MTGVTSVDPALLLAAARHDWQQGWYAAARKKLQSLVASAPVTPGLHALLAEVLFSQGEIAAAGPVLAHALQLQPDDLRLQVLQAEHLRARGALAAAGSVFKGVLARDCQRPGAWTGLLALALDGNDIAGAQAILVDGIAALDDPLPFWGAAIVAFLHSADPATLSMALAQVAAPAFASPAYVSWARTLLDAGNVAALRCLPRDEYNDAVAGAFRVLLADIAYTAGEPALAARHRAHALRGAGNEDPGWRQLWREYLQAGEIDAAEEVFRRMGPRLRHRLDLFPLHEARLFREAMAQLRAAQALAGDARVAALAQAVRDEPDCALTAAAFLHALRGRDALPATASTRGGIPARARALQASDPSWPARLAGSGFASFDDDQLVRAARMAWRAQWPPGTAVPLLSRAMQIDLARLAIIVRDGGWWLPTGRPCHGSPSLLAGDGVSLVLVQDDDGLLSTGLFAAAAGHPVLAAALDAAIAAAAGSTRPGEWTRWETGALALTLGAARVLAARVTAGEAPSGVRIWLRAEVAKRVVLLPTGT